MTTRFTHPVFFWPACVLLLLVISLFSCQQAQARADAADLFLDAMLESDVSGLNSLTAENFIFIASNGHIQDKHHFLETIRTGALKVTRATLLNMRESSAGQVRLITGNGEFIAMSQDLVPSGLIRITMVTNKTPTAERVVLVQLTPVIPSASCEDGNCLIQQ